MPNPGIARATATVSILTMLSRGLGFIRDLLVASLFGTGLVADAYVVAFRIPNLLRSFVAEGALTSAFVPIFSSQLTRGVSQAQSTLSEILGLLLSFTTLLTICGVIFAPEITTLFAPGFVATPEKLQLSATLLRIMFPYIICISVVAMLGGALNACHIYGTAALAQVLMNLFLIAGAVGAGVLKSSGNINLAAEILSWSVVAGGIAQVLLQLPALKRAGLRLVPVINFGSNSVRELIRLMIPAIIGASIYQLQIFINTLMASMLEEGSVSWLFYADRVVQLPIGVFTVALASVLLPNLSSSAAKGNVALFAKQLSDAIRYTSFVILPLATGLFVLAEPITATLFERGAFTNSSTIQTAAAIRAYSVGIWAVSIHSMLVRGFIARKDTKTPTVIGLITLLFTFITSVLLMGPLQASGVGIAYTVLTYLQNLFGLVLPFSLKWDGLGAAGLALSASLGSFLTVTITAVLLNRKVTGLTWNRAFNATVKAIVASTLMGLVLANLAFGSLHPFLGLASKIVIGVALYISISFLVKSLELNEISTLLRSKISRKLS